MIKLGMLGEFIPYLWICICITAAVVEILTLAKVAVWFVSAGFIALILAIFKVDVWFQATVFIIISLISIVLSRAISTNSKNFVKLKEKRETREYKKLIGKTAIVTEEIDIGKNTGRIRINGTIWEAKAEDEEELYEIGLIVTVVKIDGGYLICSV